MGVVQPETLLIAGTQPFRSDPECRFVKRALASENSNMKARRRARGSRREIQWV